jgi:hypothetical protein
MTRPPCGPPDAAAAARPPPGAVLFFSDAQGRPCGPSAAVLWTWLGARAWYRVAERPIPEAARPERRDAR